MPICDWAAADVVVRCRDVHTFDDARPRGRSIAIRDGCVLAVGEKASSCDDAIGKRTKILDLPDCVLMPGFHDTHVHQYDGGLELLHVPVSDARSIDDLVERIQANAKTTPPGDWIVTAKDLHVSSLREQRLPTAQELDRATTDHPVCVRRGSHAMTVNSLALRMAGLPPSSGQLGDDDAIAPVLEVMPKPDEEACAEALRGVCHLFNSMGIVAARDAGLTSEGLRTYQTLHARGQLTVRSRVMVRMLTGWPEDRILSEIDGWQVASGLGDDLLRLDGIKLFIDGRIDDAALYESGNGHVKGTLYFDADALARVVTAALRKGWSVGCHAAGEAAVDMVLDAYARGLSAVPGARPESLIVEHAFFCDADKRRRARELGIGLSIHPQLLYAFAPEMLEHWGPRSEEVMPIRALVAEDVRVAAGSDGPVPPVNPLIGIWTLVTRGTAIGERVGVHHATDRETAFRLYTVAGPRLFGDGARHGGLRQGAFADIVAFPADPLSCDVDALLELTPTFTLLAGAPVYDDQNVFGG